MKMVGIGRIALLAICLMTNISFFSAEAGAGDEQKKVSRQTLDIMLPVRIKLQDLLLLLNSAEPGKAVNDLKREVSRDISAIDEAICNLDKSFDKERAAGVKEEYAAREREWRKKTIILIGREDLPHTSLPVLESAEKASLYARYVALCGETHPAKRAEGVRGIGAIGEKNGIPLLLRMLQDRDEDVRVNAVISLAWLQASEAVPALMRLLKEDGSKWVRRRCAQALGQIGNKSAIPLLLAHIESKDPYMAENAILSLGWLHAEEAVDGLIKVLKDKRLHFPVWAWQECISPSSCAAIALGYIGDKRAYEPLVEAYKMSAEGYAEYYVLNLRKSAGLALGLLGDKRALDVLHQRGRWPYAVGTMDYSKDAAELIRQGRKEGPDGIRQHGFSSHPSFYDFGRRSFVRTLSGYQYPVYMPEEITETISGISKKRIVPLDLPMLYRSVAVTGANMWRYIEARKGFDFYPAIRERIDYMGRLGLKTQIFVDFNGGSSKADFMRVFSLYGDLPAWQGVDQEELEFSITRTWYDGERVEKRLQDYLAGKYSPAELRRLGIELSAVKIPPLKDGRNYPPELSPVLFTEYNDMKDEAYLEFFKEHTQFVHCLRRGTDCRYSFSQGYASGYPGRFWELADVCDGCGPENADRQVDEKATFWTELSRNGEARSATVFWWPGLIGGWAPSDENHVDKGFASSLAHTQGVILWGAEFYLPWALSPRAKPIHYYRNDKWEVIASYMKMAAQMEPYLTGTRLATPVALLFSERTGKSPFYCDINASAYRNAYSNTQMGIWQKLSEVHLPVEPVICETISREKLSRYKLILLANGRALSEEEENTLREFVRQGGVLLADAATTLYDRWSRPRKNYGLSDVFGLSFVGEQFYNGSSTNAAVKSSIWDKPLPGKLDKMLIPANITLANYDKVKNARGEILTRYDNGDPAITLHRYGKGVCLFSTRSFNNASAAALGEVVAWAMNSMDARLPVEVMKSPANIDIVPREQPDAGRLIIHLVNWNREDAEGVELKLGADGKRNIFYAGDGLKIEPHAINGQLVIPVRKFKTYEAIVIER